MKNKIDFREKEAKRFKEMLKAPIVNCLPDVSCVVFTMRHKDVVKLFDVKSLILN